MLIYLYYFIFGTMFGSFANVLIYRLPKGQSVVFPASACMSCGNKLKPYHNIPILSWLFLRGRCAYCKAKICIQYPAVEFASGILFAFAFYKLHQNINAVFLGLSLIFMLSLSVIDFRYCAVPEGLLFITYIFALASNYDSTALLGMISHLSFEGSRFYDSLIIIGIITLIKTITSLWKNRNNKGEIIETMGDADTIVMASMAALLGIKLALVSVFIGAIITLPFFAIASMKKKEEIAMPMIPFLFAGTLIVLMFDSQISNFLKAYFRV